jgi:hypothetical protein
MQQCLPPRRGTGSSEDAATGATRLPVWRTQENVATCCPVVIPAWQIPPVSWPMSQK